MRWVYPDGVAARQEWGCEQGTADLSRQPLRQSMGYSEGTGFGGQLAEWLPAPESADVALLPSIQLGNARADDLVRNNGIAANAVEIHKDHIVGHMFRLSYRPNWRWLGMSEADSHAFIEDVEAAWMEYCDPVFGSMDVEGRRSFTEFIREGVGSIRLTVKFLSSPYGIRNPRHYSEQNSRPSVRSASARPVMVPAIVLCVPEWKSTVTERRWLIMFRTMTGLVTVSATGHGLRRRCPPGDRE